MKKGMRRGPVKNAQKHATPKKRARFDKKNEEIESSSSEEEDIQKGLENNNSKGGSDESQEEEFFSANSGEDEDETAQEKKLRLAKLYLEEIEKQEKSRREDEYVDEDLIASRLKDDVLEADGRLKKDVADAIEPDLDNMFSLTSSRHLKRSVTCLCISEDGEWIFSGSKDGHIIKWSVKEKCKVGMIKKSEVPKKKSKKGKQQNGKIKIPTITENPDHVHFSTITAMAISSDGQFLASGDENCKIIIWNPNSLQRIHTFTGHRGAIRGLTFRKKKHTLYSCSDDRSVRVWCLDAMGYVESLFGHQDAVTCIDALTRERVLTGGGRDNTLRVWKIVEESQLVYNGHPSGTIDSVKLINEENFASCGDDGNLCVWNVNRKKPLVTIPNAHGSYKSFPESELESSRWISALASCTNSDLIASGSSDGLIRFWKCGERFKSLEASFTVQVEGWINTMQFSLASENVGDDWKGKPKFVAVGTGKEHRLGRWFQDIKTAKNGIVVIPFKHKSS